LAELRLPVVGRDPVVHRQRQHEAAAERRSVNGGDDRLALPQLFQLVHRLLPAARERRRFGLRLHPGQHRDVGAHDEAVGLGGGENNRLDRRVLGELLESLLELLVEIGAQRVRALARDIHQQQRDAVLSDIDAKRAHVRSRMTAAPRPPAAQTEISAVFLPFSSSSRSAWCTIRAPVAANGWPSAILPPRGLIFSSGISPIGCAPPRCSSANFFDAQACRFERTCAAKASWISTRSMSFSVIPARFSALGAVKAGACRSCQFGSTAAYAYDLRKPSGLRPSSFARSSAQTTSAAAPSVSGEEFPAVMLPY